MEPDSICPFLVVTNLDSALSYYQQQLGFEVEFTLPDEAPFFAIVRRGGAKLLLKEVGVDALPNSARHPDARWDAYAHTADPDALYADLVERGATIHRPLADTEDGLRAFEVRDADGHVLCFGRPR